MMIDFQSTNMFTLLGTSFGSQRPHLGWECWTYFDQSAWRPLCPHLQSSSCFSKWSRCSSLFIHHEQVFLLCEGHCLKRWANGLSVLAYFGDRMHWFALLVEWKIRNNTPVMELLLKLLLPLFLLSPLPLLGFSWFKSRCIFVVPMVLIIDIWWRRSFVYI